MGDHKHKSKDRDSRKKSKKENKERRDHKKHKKSSKKTSSDDEADVDYSDPSLWVEKANDTPPPAESTPASEPAAARHGWMLDESFDFGSMGVAQKKEEAPKPEPKVSVLDVNPYVPTGVSLDNTSSVKKGIEFGDAGSSWRMMKLRRVMEQAEDEQRPLEEVALERYGTMEKVKEAFAEREYLDQRKSRGGRGSSRRGESDRGDRRGQQEGQRFMFTNTDPAAPQSSFRRPDHARRSPQEVDEFGREMKRRRRRSVTPSPSTPPSSSTEAAAKKLLAEAANAPVHTPVLITQHDLPNAFSTESNVSRDQLNKLNAKIVKARLIGSDNLEALEKEYEEQVRLFEMAQEATGSKKVEVLPTVDSQGKLYDYALSRGPAMEESSHIGQSKKRKEKFEGTHDRVTGERLKYASSDDTMSLMDMVKQEKAGSRSATNMDLDFANRIVRDARFEDNLEYLDEKADIMATKKGVSEEQKMRSAIQDYKKVQSALDKCRLCYHFPNPPQVSVIALGVQTYLALPNVTELVPFHCQIIPVSHVSSTLELDNEVWDEIRNFQKCLMQMFHEQDCGVVFMETAMNFRQHRHTAIEVIPIPYGVYEDAAAYFKEAIMSSEEEWTQHKKLIDTSARGFRNCMVKNLPYFHVWCGLDKSYGHVIENEREFPYWFGKEVVAGMLDIGPERWRRPRFCNPHDNRKRLEEFSASWKKWDWTAQLEQEQA